MNFANFLVVAAVVVFAVVAVLAFFPDSTPSGAHLIGGLAVGMGLATIARFAPPV